MDEKRISPIPPSFTSPDEKDYWHEAQDIAFRAGASLIVRDGTTWLVSDDGERLVCEPDEPSRLWYKTWLVLDREFPALSRLWVKGRAITKPGEMQQMKARLATDE